MNNKKWFFILVCIFLMIGCATQSTRQPERVNTGQLPAQKEKEIELDLLTRTERDWRLDGDDEKRNARLVELAEQYLFDRQCNEASTIIAKLSGSLFKTDTYQRAQLIKSECALFQLDQNITPLALIQSWLDEVPFSAYSARRSIAQAKVHALNSEYALAIRHKLPYLGVKTIINEDAALNIWEWYSELDANDRAKINVDMTALRPYSELFELINNTSLSDSDRQFAIKDWRVRHLNHPLNTDFPDPISQFLQTEIKKPQQITVLLPLTGNLQAQGEAIKQGIMTAYLQILEYNNANDPGNLLPRIVFLDTGSGSKLSNDVRNTTELFDQSDLIIGPLLRSHIEQLKTLNYSNTPTIYLNRIEGESEYSNSVYFSLAPEDEARQLARMMLNNGVQSPILITNDSGISNRMLETFEATWKEYGALQHGQAFAERNMPVIRFTDNKSMRIGITSALDVLQSQQRIAQLNNLTPETVYSVTRNRRDIDAFAVFAKPDELELINPIIEASISLFSEVNLPVFATSHSYQHQLNKNSIRDLRNIVFIDMPWLLPTGRNNDFAAQIDEIWNQPSSSFLRLFAFGYDSFQFAERFSQLKFFKQNSLNGFTGRLRVNEFNQVTRSLPVARVAEEDIVEE